MSETSDAQLEQTRFHVSPESMKGMNAIKDTFSDLQQEHPWLSGLGFFGSRIKGTEHQGSDFDVCVFYNSERITDVFSGTNGAWDEIYQKLGESAGASLDHRLAKAGAGMRIDLSHERTLKQIELFEETAKPFVDQDIDETLIDKIGSPPAQNLAFRFFLSTGDEVYSNRKFVLEHFKSNPNGEKYFQMLMNYLQWFERENVDPTKPNVPTYKRYPTTIEDAEKYFQTKPSSTSSNETAMGEHVA